MIMGNMEENMGEIVIIREVCLLKIEYDILNCNLYRLIGFESNWKKILNVYIIYVIFSFFEIYKGCEYGRYYVL